MLIEALYSDRKKCRYMKLFAWRQHIRRAKKYKSTSLHTLGAANTIDRIIDVFPYSRQQQFRLYEEQVIIIILRIKKVRRIIKKRVHKKLNLNLISNI